MQGKQSTPVQRSSDIVGQIMQQSVRQMSDSLHLKPHGLEISSPLIGFSAAVSKVGKPVPLEEADLVCKTSTRLLALDGELPSLSHGFTHKQGPL